MYAGTRWLDDFALVEAQIAYGTLGTRGALEYEGGRVRVMGRGYGHALSTHGPARVVFRLDAEAAGLHAAVALNDDVIGQAAHAHFLVRADGRLVAQAADVRPGEPPRALSADVRGARTLELLVLTAEHDYCHSVWLEPRVDSEPGPPPRPRVCALARTEITPPEPRPSARRCIATTVSPGFTGHLDDLLGSIVANARCPDALLAVFAVDPDEECVRVAARYGAALVRCRGLGRVNATIKAVLYSAAHAIDADEFVCLDGDMLVLEDLRPLFAALSVHPPASVLACREANDHRFPNLMQVLTGLYYGHSSDIRRLTGDDRGGDFTLVINDGTFAARREALLRLDGEIARWTGAPAWVDERRDVPYRNQFVFNLALARFNCAVEIDPAYNLQLNWQDAAVGWRDGRVEARWHGRPVRVLHFNGDGRHKHPEWRGWYAAPAPMLGAGADDGFDAFESALRSWVGRHGVQMLEEPLSALPRCAAVHHLVRANGCTRAIETGTGRGVSAALLACTGASVVTLDLAVHAEREPLWASLGSERHARIEPRTGDSLAGLQAALDAGERYDVAFLNSAEDHVWSQFLLAAQLVGPGGLILVPSAAGGALRGAEERGYGVIRLRAGLALIENRG